MTIVVSFKYQWFYLKDHVKHHGKATLAWILSGRVQRRQIKQVCACLLADCMDQHLLTYTLRPCQQDGLYQRSLLMYHLRACKQHTHLTECSNNNRDFFFCYVLNVMN